MSIGKVHVWYMTPEQLAEYVKKHPIVPTGKTSFSTEAIDYEVINERKKEALKGKTIIDKLDKNKLQKLYMEGSTIPDIAQEFDINKSTLKNYIYAQRKVDPEKWTRPKK
jgi:hypothetical protein